MIARIIPILRLPPSVGPYFDYRVPEKLEGEITLGQIVAIPFRGRKKAIYGVVVEVKKRGTSKKTMKEISSLPYPQPLVTLYQIKLAKYVSQTAGVSQALAMKTIAPEVPKKYELRITNYELRFKKNANTQFEKKPQLFHYNSFSERDEFVADMIKNTVGQVLIVVPEIADINKFSIFNFQFSIAFIHSKLSKSELFSSWLSILSGESKIIIGTRSALFMPLQNLGAVVIDQEHSASLDNLEQQPHYRAFDIAEFLAKQFQCPLIVSSYAPKVKTWEKAKYGVYKQRTTHGSTLRSRTQGRGTVPSSSTVLSSLPKGSPSRDNSQLLTKNTSCQIIDMTEEVRKENYSPISDSLRDKISLLVSCESSVVSRNVFLFLNKRGFSHAVVCKDCGYFFECPQCLKPLISHKNAPGMAVSAEEALLCHTCGYREELPPFCPKCDGPHFIYRGKGTQKIEALLKEEFAGINIVRLDRDTGKSTPSPNLSLSRERDITSPPSKGERKREGVSPTLFIGTEFALSRLPWETIGLIGILDVDSMLALPDAHATERVYQLIRRIETYLISSPYKGGVRRGYSLQATSYGSTLRSRTQGRGTVPSSSTVLSSLPKGSPSRDKLQADLIIQTHAPTLPIFRALVENKPEIFYEAEIEMSKLTR